MGNIPQEVPCVSCFWRGIVGRTLTEFSALRTLIWAETRTLKNDKYVTASSIISNIIYQCNVKMKDDFCCHKSWTL